jgi:hypothetical protein
VAAAFLPGKARVPDDDLEGDVAGAIDLTAARAAGAPLRT